MMLRHGGSRPGRSPIAVSAEAATAAEGRTGSARRRVEDVEAGQELEGSLFESGLDVAGGATERCWLEPLVGESRAAGADVVGYAGRPRSNANDSESLDGFGGDDADVGHPVDERAVEEECVPGP